MAGPNFKESSVNTSTAAAYLLKQGAQLGVETLARGDKALDGYKEWVDGEGDRKYAKDRNNILLEDMTKDEMTAALFKSGKENEVDPLSVMKDNAALLAGVDSLRGLSAEQQANQSHLESLELGNSKVLKTAIQDRLNRTYSELGFTKEIEDYQNNTNAPDISEQIATYDSKYGYKGGETAAAIQLAKNAFREQTGVEMSAGMVQALLNKEGEAGWGSFDSSTSSIKQRGVSLGTRYAKNAKNRVAIEGLERSAKQGVKHIDYESQRANLEYLKKVQQNNQARKTGRALPHKNLERPVHTDNDEIIEQLEANLFSIFDVRNNAVKKDTEAANQILIDEGKKQEVAAQKAREASEVTTSKEAALKDLGPIAAALRFAPGSEDYQEFVDSLTNAQVRKLDAYRKNFGNRK
jgi:hypothetical protein